jgi:hypothetical protein
MPINPSGIPLNREIYGPQPLRLTATNFKYAVLGVFLVAYVATTFIIFFQLVIPTFNDNSTSEVFAVDSTVYTYFADTIREGRPDPWVLESLASFPNTLWVPTFISLVLKSPLLIMLFNYGLFAVSLAVYRRSSPIALTVFIPLLLLNPTTTTSILCVNKEIVDFFELALFLSWQKTRRRKFLLAAMLLALFNRYELCVVMGIIVLAESHLNPLRKHRLATLLSLTLALNFVMPVWGAKNLALRFEEAQYAGVVRALDEMQLHYMYVLVVLPKIADNFFGFLFNPGVWTASTSWLLINFFNNFATAIVLLVLLVRRSLKLRNDLIYFAGIGAVMVAQALAVQPRYFYFVYVLLCLQAAQIAPEREGLRAIERSSNTSRDRDDFGAI